MQHPMIFGFHRLGPVRRNVGDQKAVRSIIDKAAVELNDFGVLAYSSSTIGSLKAHCSVRIRVILLGISLLQRNWTHDDERSGYRRWADGFGAC